jgi:hypothetical protein
LLCQHLATPLKDAVEGDEGGLGGVITPWVILGGGGGGSRRPEDGRGSLRHAATLRFPSPLIEPDVRISRIRLSDWLHREAHETNHCPQVSSARCALFLRLTNRIFASSLTEQLERPLVQNPPCFSRTRKNVQYSKGVCENAQNKGPIQPYEQTGLAELS